jgi:hypothetical protein
MGNAATDVAGAGYGIMTEEIADGDDYADWIKWVSDAEKNLQTMHESTHDVPVPLLLQLSRT